MTLSGRQKRALRAMGHHLRPVVIIGKNGLAETVLQQLEDNLTAQELVKVKVLKACPVALESLIEAITAGTGAELAQRIGRTLLLYRPLPDPPPGSQPQ